MPSGEGGNHPIYFRVKPSKKLTEARFFKDVARLAEAIRASDTEGLDILPANPDFGDFDLFLSRMRNSRSRLKTALASVGADYDVILLDCPPGVSRLSENIFRAADLVLVPVIPTTLSARSFDQLREMIKEQDLPAARLAAFFSMVQGTKSLHQQVMQELRAAHPKRFLATAIPSASEIERMGVTRAPVSKGAAAKAYAALAAEVMGRV